MKSSTFQQLELKTQCYTYYGRYLKKIIQHTWQLKNAQSHSLFQHSAFQHSFPAESLQHVIHSSCSWASTIHSTLHYVTKQLKPAVQFWRQFVILLSRYILITIIILSTKRVVQNFIAWYRRICEGFLTLCQFHSSQHYWVYIWSTFLPHSLQAVMHKVTSVCFLSWSNTRENTQI